MSLVSLKEVLNDARKNKYAVGAFDVSNIEMAIAVVEVAEEKKSPVILMGLCLDLQGDRLDYWLYSLRKIAPFVIIDCGSYIASDILSAVALMEADSVLQLASCDLKSVGYLSSQLPLLGELKWDKDKQYRVASNIKPFQAADRIGQVLGSVVFRLPYSQELEEQYLAGNLLADLVLKDSRPFRKELERIIAEVF